MLHNKEALLTHHQDHIQAATPKGTKVPPTGTPTPSHSAKNITEKNNPHFHHHNNHPIEKPSEDKYLHNLIL